MFENPKRRASATSPIFTSVSTVSKFDVKRDVGDVTLTQR